MNYKKAFTLFMFVLLIFAMQACAPAPSTPVGITVPTPAVVDAGSAPPQSPTAQPVTVQTKMSATFDAANSGSLCPNRSPESDLGNSPSVVGEGNDTYTCEGFWTFTLSQLPQNAQVTLATFSPGPCTVNGAPFSYGDLIFEYPEIGTLDIGDYGQGGTAWDIFKECPASVNMTSYVQSRVNAGETSVQIRAYFESGYYGNGIDDYISFQTVSAPTLVVEYNYTQ
ncbi:MAG: hypothetical protein GXP40_10580 [Chloroflexi bacterium]|nr:hypothetical protein [Chloroflexota bacterium]